MWTVIIEVGFKLLSWLLDRAKVSKEAKEAFFEFVKKAGSDLGSVKLMKYGDDQLAWLRSNPWKETV